MVLRVILLVFYMSCDSSENIAKGAGCSFYGTIVVLKSFGRCNISEQGCQKNTEAREVVFGIGFISYVNRLPTVLFLQRLQIPTMMPAARQRLVMRARMKLMLSLAVRATLNMKVQFLQNL